MLKKILCVGALCLAFVGPSLQAGTLVLGEPPKTGNCDPFGCPTFFGLGTYQQVYLNSAFPGAISIDDLTFVQAINNGGVPASGTFTLTFSYTSGAPGDLDLTNAANNIGSGSEGFFTGTLPAMTVDGNLDLLTFAGTPFVYNPADGNLLLTVSVTGSQNTTPYLYLDEAGSTAVTSDAYFGPVNGGNDPGLVTSFEYTNPTGTPTPEPGSLLLVLAGIGLIGYQLRRRVS
jgi:hypothetical protein